MFDFILAYAAGLLTVLNPCVLPLLPLIAASAVARHPLGPVAMATGMAISFTVAGMGLFALTRATGLQQEDISFAVGWLMLGFGAILLIPQAQARFAAATGGLAGGSTQAISKFESKGLGGEAMAGGLLGLAWSPCIGPTLGAAIGLAAQGESLGYAGGIMALFSLGAATIMLGLAYGARSLIAQRREWLQKLSRHASKILGVGLVLVGLALIFHLDRVVEYWAVTTLPSQFIDFSVSI